MNRRRTIKVAIASLPLRTRVAGALLRSRIAIALLILIFALAFSAGTGLAQPARPGEVELEGTVEVLHEDRDVGSRYVYFLQTATERLELRFASDPPALVSGDRIRARGLRTNGVLALTSGSSTQTLSSGLQNTFGAQKTLVILVNFADKQIQPYTVSYAQGVVNTTSNFDLENSFQQTWLNADVVGWYAIAQDSTVCDYNKTATLAEQAAAANGVNVSAYNRRVYAFPDNACTWWGLGTVGGNPSRAWISGSFTLKVLGHEMGHNYGLYHSRSLDCGTTVLGPSCTVSEYGDTLDIMGNPSSGHFNAFQKERLGWLAYDLSPPITDVMTDGVYWIAPYEWQNSDPKALKILKSTDPSTGKSAYYYAEYRWAAGFDGFLSSNSNVLNGVVIHTGSESSANSSYLLDMTAGTSSWSDPALVVGQSYEDPDAGVTITVLSVDGTGASVSVTFGPEPCVQANPTVTLSPSQSQWVKPGASATYTVAVANKDGAGCGASSFNLQAAAPSGWASGFGSSTLTVNPGATASTTLTVTSPASATDGFYGFSATATNGSDTAYTGSVSGTVVIVSSLGVSVSTDKATYSRNQSVSIAAAVSALGSPVANASVTFTITKANGSVITQTVTTGTNGIAVYKLRLTKKDPVGSYQVKADANANGITGSAVTSFKVQ